VLGIVDTESRRLTCLLEELGALEGPELMQRQLNDIGPMLLAEFRRAEFALDETHVEHPRFARRIDELEREHAQALASLDQLLARCERAAMEARALVRGRDALLRTVRRLRSTENQLFLEVYLRDLGGQG
jgi:phosphatidylserine/phosphatidylglycerophosphate/cardiolipin synthase-like enzyme